MTMNNIRSGITHQDYINACRVRGTIQRELDRLLARYDAIATPTLLTVAGPIDQPFASWSRGFSGTQIGGAGNVAACCVAADVRTDGCVQAPQSACARLSDTAVVCSRCARSLGARYVRQRVCVRVRVCVRARARA